MPAKTKSDLRQKCKKIRMIVLDVDGVLTDGRIVYDDRGRELKSFSVQDGFGISRAVAQGMLFAIISGRKSPIVSRRARELGIREVIQDQDAKLGALQRIMRKHRLRPEEVCCVGDDELDLPILQIAGLSAAPANAMRAVQRCADFVTEHTGGYGAVREVIDLILRAQGSTFNGL